MQKNGEMYQIPATLTAEPIAHILELVSRVLNYGSLPVRGIPGESSPGVGINHEEVLPPHVLLDGVGLDTGEAVEGLLGVRVDRGLCCTVQPFQL